MKNVNTILLSMAIGVLFILSGCNPKSKKNINRHGGDATLVELPKIGIYGNTHFPMSDLNNIDIADLLSVWMREKGLDKNN